MTGTPVVDLAHLGLDRGGHLLVKRALRSVPAGGAILKCALTMERKSVGTVRPGTRVAATGAVTARITPSPGS